jgi:hypothetical protein
MLLVTILSTSACVSVVDDVINQENERLVPNNTSYVEEEGCSDSGAACVGANPLVLEYSAKCDEGSALVSCFCATAATAQCLINHGCYVGESSRETQTTLEDLEQERSEALRQAQIADGTCQLP